MEQQEEQLEFKWQNEARSTVKKMKKKKLNIHKNVQKRQKQSNKKNIVEEKAERKLLTNIKIHRMLHHFYDNRTFLWQKAIGWKKNYGNI